MKEWCERLGIMTAFLGTLIAVFLALVYGRIPGVMQISIRSWPLTMAIFVIALAVVAIITTILLAISEILLNLEAIIEIQDAYGAEFHELYESQISGRQRWKLSKKNPAVETDDDISDT